MPRKEQPRPQTEFWGTWDAANRRAIVSVAIGFVVAILPVIVLTDGLPIVQRVGWFAGASVVIAFVCGWFLLIGSGEALTPKSLLDAETALTDAVSEPAVIAAIRSAPDLEQQLQAAQNLSTLTVAPAPLIAVGPLGLAVGPSKPGGGATHVVERARVDDLVVTVTSEYEQWPSITVTLRSRRDETVALEFFPASRQPVSQWVSRRVRPVEADEREVRELVAAMRLALGLPSASAPTSPPMA